MKPTPTEITECTDEKVLCDWAAIHCMGYVKGENSLGDKCYRRGSAFIYHYDPTSPTEKGKEQCFDLIVKFDCYPKRIKCSSGDWFIVPIKKFLIEHENPQIAVVKAALLSAIGE